jgi:hypothetical protein
VTCDGIIPIDAKDPFAGVSPDGNGAYTTTVGLATDSPLDGALADVAALFLPVGVPTAAIGPLAGVSPDGTPFVTGLGLLIDLPPTTIIAAATVVSPAGAPSYGATTAAGGVPVPVMVAPTSIAHSGIPTDVDSAQWRTCDGIPAVAKEPAANVIPTNRRYQLSAGCTAWQTES